MRKSIDQPRLKNYHMLHNWILLPTYSERALRSTSTSFTFPEPPRVYFNITLKHRPVHSLHPRQRCAFQSNRVHQHSNGAHRRPHARMPRQLEYSSSTHLRPQHRSRRPTSLPKQLYITIPTSPSLELQRPFFHLQAVHRAQRDPTHPRWPRRQIHSTFYPALLQIRLRAGEAAFTSETHQIIQEGCAYAYFDH